MDGQDGLALFIVCGCAAYLAYRAKRAWQSAGGCGCDKPCSGNDPEVVSISSDSSDSPLTRGND